MAATSAPAAAAATTAPAAGAAKKGGTLKAGLFGSDILSLDPMTSGAIIDREVYYNIYDSLVAIDVNAQIIPALAEKWELMGVRVRQGYGATEAAPIITSDSLERRKEGAVGRPFPGVEVQIAPDGEILARGPNIFRGYWENPEATASALVDASNTPATGTVDMTITPLDPTGPQRAASLPLVGIPDGATASVPRTR